MKVTITFLILVLTILFGFSNNKHSNIEKESIIKGKILNHDKHPDNNTIKVVETNFVNPSEKYHTAFLENDGTFKIEFKKSFSSDVYLMYGNLVTIFVGPGDSVYVELDADEFLNQNQENRYNPKSLKFSGSNNQINEEIKTFICSLNLSSPSAFEK